VLVMVNGHVDLPSGVPALAVDEAGEWIAFRKDAACGMLCRPELTPGVIEDIIMEEGRSLPENISDVLATARAEWPQTRRTTDDVFAALVTALDLMRERRRMPVFALRAIKEQ
jgi:hypothetical protein